MTCQCLTDYVKVAFHMMMMHLLMMMMSTSLPIVMMMLHLLISEHLLNPMTQIIIRYSIFYVVLDLYSYLYDCMIYIVGMYNFLTLYDCFLHIVPWSSCPSPSALARFMIR